MMKNLTRTVWVGYNSTKGFVKGKITPGYTDDFRKARLYSRKADLLNSINRMHGYKKDGITPVGITIGLPEETALLLRLGSDPNETGE